MIKSCILLLMLSHSSNSKRLEDVFNLDADDIFAAEYGSDFYAARKRLQSKPYKPFNINDTMALMFLRKRNATNLKLNTTTKAPDISTERIPMASIPPDIAARFQNISLRDIKNRRLKLQLDRILNSNRSVQNYLANSDVKTFTRRGSGISDGLDYLDNYLFGKPAPAPHELLYLQRHEKRRMVDLMTHFIYISRYKLVYPQLLRKKYMGSYVYKLGYLFALLRHLKSMQKYIVHIMKKKGWPKYDSVGTVYFDLKLVERLQRIDIDIKDVVLLIEKMEYRANIAYNPNFYEYSLEA